MVQFVTFIFLIIANPAFVKKLPNPIPSPREESKPIQNPGTDQYRETDTPNKSSKKPFLFIDRQYSAAVSNPNVDNPSNKQSETPSDNRIVWLTVGLLIVGGIQAYIYCRQARLMREGLKKTEEANRVAEQAANAAAASAKATKEGIENAKHGLRIVERAHIAFGSGLLHDPDKDGLSRVTFIIKNTGRTPATLGGYYMTGGTDEDLSFILLDYIKRLHTERNGTVLPTQGGYVMNITSLNAIERNFIYSKAKTLYVFLYFEYRDAFGDLHESASLMRYDVDRKQFFLFGDAKYNYST